MARSRQLLALALLVVTGATAGAQANSPFASPGQPATSVAAADADFEFTGVIAGSEKVLINLTRVRDRRSFWLSPGESVSGVSVESFAAETNQVTLRLGELTQTLSLKSSPKVGSFSGGGQFVAPPPLPVAAVAPRVAVTDEEKATEARMLVSDLLEIGMLQRQAYEEAQRTAVRETPPASADQPQP